MESNELLPTAMNQSQSQSELSLQVTEDIILQSPQHMQYLKNNPPELHAICQLLQQIKIHPGSETWHPGFAQFQLLPDTDHRYVSLRFSQDKNCKIIVSFRLFLHYVFGPNWTVGTKLDEFERKFLLQMKEQNLTIPLLLSFQDTEDNGGEITPVLKINIKLDPFYLTEELTKLENEALNELFLEKKEGFALLWDKVWQNRQLIQSQKKMLQQINHMIQEKKRKSGPFYLLQQLWAWVLNVALKIRNKFKP